MGKCGLDDTCFVISVFRLHVAAVARVNSSKHLKQALV